MSALVNTPFGTVKLDDQLKWVSDDPKLTQVAYDLQPIEFSEADGDPFLFLAKGLQSKLGGKFFIEPKRDNARPYKPIRKSFAPDIVDRDSDGLIYDGTPIERPKFKSNKERFEAAHKEVTRQMDLAQKEVDLLVDGLNKYSEQATKADREYAEAREKAVEEIEKIKQPGESNADVIKRLGQAEVNRVMDEVKDRYNLKTLMVDKERFKRAADGSRHLLGPARGRLNECLRKKMIADIAITEKFQNWFGDSKTVGKDGLPLVIFHGTEKGVFSEFEERFMDDIGIFGSTDIRIAATYSGGYHDDVTPTMASDWDDFLKMVDPSQLEVRYGNESIGDFETIEKAEAANERYDEDGEIVEHYRLYDRDGSLHTESFDRDVILDEFNTNPELRTVNNGEGVYPLFYGMKDPYILDCEHRNWDDADGEGGRTRDVVKMAHEMGHDGVIFMNLMDDGGKGKGAPYGDVYVSIDNNVKSIHAKEFDPNERDILKSFEPKDGDGDGKIFDGTKYERAVATAPMRAIDTQSFKDWFGKSEVVDENGNPLKVYHGTNRAFEAFDRGRDRGWRNDRYQGNGLFFTEDPIVALKYADAAANQSFDAQTLRSELKEKYPGFVYDLYEAMVEHGHEKGWQITDEKYGLENKTFDQYPVPNIHGSDERVDLNFINTLAEFTEGSKFDSGPVDELDAIRSAMGMGVGSRGLYEGDIETAKQYGLTAPKVRVVPVYLRAEKVLRTDDPEKAKRAEQDGYDGVYYYGDGTVDGKPEWIVFDPKQVKSAGRNDGNFSRDDANIYKSFEPRDGDGDGFAFDGTPREYRVVSQGIRKWAKQKFGDDRVAENFARWFGSSKVVDDRGNPEEQAPIVAYHGTANGGFREFDSEKADKRALYGPGFYFTADESIAREYQEKGERSGDSKPEVKKAYLRIRKPWDLDNDKFPPNFERYGWRGKTFSQISADMWDTYEFRSFSDDELPPKYTGPVQGSTKIRIAQFIQDEIRKLGYDGMTHIGGKNIGNRDHKVWIALDPHQIKATDNAGTFDESTADVYKSLKPKDGDGDGRIFDGTPQEQAAGGSFDQKLQKVKDEVRPIVSKLMMSGRMSGGGSTRDEIESRVASKMFAGAGLDEQDQVASDLKAAGMDDRHINFGRLISEGERPEAGSPHPDIVPRNILGFKHDGIIWTEILDNPSEYTDVGPSTTVAVFNPSDIKSAIGNDGSFSGSDDIRKSQMHFSFDAPRDGDGDGKVNDGTPQELPAAPKQVEKPARKKAKTSAELKAEMMAALGATKETSIDPRLTALGYQEVCGRCGGSGEYSYNMKDGTVCYGCNGRGTVPPKITQAMIDQVAKRVQAGELEPYFERIKEDARIAKLAKSVMGRYSDAWNANESVIAGKGKHFTELSGTAYAVNHIAAHFFEILAELTRDTSIRAGYARMPYTDWHKENGYERYKRTNNLYHKYDKDALKVVMPAIDQVIDMVSNLETIMMFNGIKDRESPGFEQFAKELFDKYDFGKLLHEAGYGQHSFDLKKSFTPKDGDGDGFINDGTPYEQRVSKVGDAANAGAKRTRETIQFDKPIVGPSGAAMISYDWKWTLEDIGRDEPVKVSDWSQSERNEHTGRDIVHHFAVRTGKELHVVSLETAIELLGFGKQGGNKVRTLARTLFELAIAKKKLADLEAEEDHETNRYRIWHAKQDIDRLDGNRKLLEEEARKESEGRNPVDEYRDLLKTVTNLKNAFCNIAAHTNYTYNDKIYEIAKEYQKQRDKFGMFGGVTDGQLYDIKKDGRVAWNKLNIVGGFDAAGGGGKTPIDASDAKIRNWYKAKQEKIADAIEHAESWIRKYHPLYNDGQPLAEIKKSLKPKDGDGDGKIYDGTPYEQIVDRSNEIATRMNDRTERDISIAVKSQGTDLSGMMAILNRGNDKRERQAWAKVLESSGASRFNVEEAWDAIQERREPITVSMLNGIMGEVASIHGKGELDVYDLPPADAVNNRYRLWNWARQQVIDHGNKPHAWEGDNYFDPKKFEGYPEHESEEAIENRRKYWVARTKVRGFVVETLKQSSMNVQTRETYLKAFEKSMDSIPAGALEKISDRVEDIVWYQNSRDLTDGVDPDSKRIIGGAWVGYHSSPNGKLHLDGESGNLDMKGVYTHELGHVADWIDGVYDIDEHGELHSRGKSISDTYEWSEAFKSEIDGPLDSPRLSLYAISSPSEGFAEFARYAWSGVRPSEIQESFPKCWAVFEQHGLVKPVRKKAT